MVEYSYTWKGSLFMKTLTAQKNDAGQRLDSFLRKIMPEAPASLIYKYIRTNKIKVNSKKPKNDLRLCEGDIITYYGDSSLIRRKDFTPHEAPLDVVFEDDNILIVNKPPLMACQPDAKHKYDTLSEIIKSYLFSKGEYTPSHEHTFAPALCNRIDFNTSGLCIAAKNAEALRIINGKLKNREIKRYYICVTEGIPEPREGTIKTLLSKDKLQNKSIIVGSGGKDAETRYKVMKIKGGEALVEAEIVSGRTHQVRLHLSSIGCPIKCDPKYGRGGAGQFLTSYKTVFAFKTDAGKLGYLKDKTVTIPFYFPF